MIRYERDGDRWIARAEVRVGIGRVPIRLDLGALPREPDPGGLRGTPVVVVAASSLPLARAGASRAGKVPGVLIVPASATRLSGRLLVAVEEGVDIVLVEDGDAGALTAARALGGTPILPAPVGASSVLADLAVDVTIAIPARGGADLERFPDVTVSGGPGWSHHPIAVDPRPAFDELGLDLRTADPEELGAAAAGVLAGRLAAGNRRWRPG